MAGPTLGTPVHRMRRRSLRLSSKQNDHGDCSEISPDYGHSDRNLESSLTPVHKNLVQNLRQRLEKQMSAKIGNTPTRTVERTSPVLHTLRMTPGHNLQEKQDLLVRKHEQAKSRKANGIGGGISIWPEMENMRLTNGDFRFIIVAAIGTFSLVLFLFFSLHGDLVQSMTNFQHRLRHFNAIHPIDTTSGKEQFHGSLINWHQALSMFLDKVQSMVNTKLSKAPFYYKLYICFYIGGITTLLYYIADNVFAKNRLTPRRIKIWVCLLVATGTWTVLMIQLLALAQSIESSLQKNVHHLNSLMVDLVYSSFDLMTYRDIRSYWQTRCLPPTAEGLLTILDIVAVQDVSYYLQYYSLPIITALLTPVIKLIQGLISVYSAKPHA